MDSRTINGSGGGRGDSPSGAAGAAKGGLAKARTQLEPRRKPQQARSRSRVEAIIRATRELLAEGEFQSITTKSIAERAGVPVAAVYYLYPNKFSIFIRIFEEDLAKVEGIVAGGSEIDAERWEERFGETMDAVIQFWCEEKAFGTLWEERRRAKELRVVDEAANERIIGTLEAMLGRIAPHLKPQERWAAAHTINFTSDRLLTEIRHAESKRIANVLGREMKRILTTYIQSYL